RRDFELASWSFDGGHEQSVLRFGDRQVEAQGGDLPGGGTSILVGCVRLEAQQPAALRCVDRWMNRIATPFDEKRKQASRIALQAHHFPGENAAVGALS